MATKNFQVNDLVWAKMTGYSPWPGKIAYPPAAPKARRKKCHHYVYFFGSNNYAWIADENIQMHSEELVKKYSKRKNSTFVRAIETITEAASQRAEYNKSNESSESDENASETKEQRNNLEKIAMKSVKRKSKKLKSSSTPFKEMKKLPSETSSSVKKLSLEKKAASKSSHSSDQIESDDSTSYFSQRILDPVPSRSLKIQKKYAEFMSNVPPYPGNYRLPVPTLNILERKHFDLPDVPAIDLSYQSEFLKEKVIEPTNKIIGLLGLNEISQGIVKNLYQSGHSVIIWDQGIKECEEFTEKFNIKAALTPADVVERADITFSCVFDQEVVKRIVFGNCGILKELECSGDQKGYVEMTTMDPKVSLSIASQIKSRNGRYLEAPLCGSRVDANEIILFTAGDKTLYNDCESCFNAFAKTHKFVSTDVGSALKLGLIHNMLVVTVHAAVKESLALTSKIGLTGDVIFDVIKEGVANTENIATTTISMLNNDYTSNTPLKRVQQDLHLGLLLGRNLKQSTPILATVNEVYKRCKSMSYGDYDVSVVYEATKS